MTNEHGLTAPRCVWDIKGITPTEKLVLLAMASSKITLDGITEVSTEKLGRMCNLSQRPLLGVISNLAAAGLVETFNRPSGTAYRLRLHGSP